MPWTITDPPPPAQNWSKKKKRACVRAANAALKRGGSEKDAILACIGAANNAKQYDESLEDDYEDLVEEARLDMIGYGEQLVEGEISENQFRNLMRDRIKELLIALALLGNLSLDQPEDMDDLALFINSSYGLLDDFMDTIGTEDPSGKYIRWRAGLYANHRHVFVRYLLPRDLFLALPEMPGISCLGDGWCGCWLEYNETDTGYEVFWNMNPLKEHCEVCKALAIEWSPYIVSFSDMEG